MSVYKKILAVMQDVEYLQKDDQVAFGNTKYKAISEEKVTSTIRASLVKNGLVIIPVEQEHIREPIGDKGNYLSTVNVKYKIVDVETGDFTEAVSSGTGVDTQDKGVGKAMTYCYKYLLLRTFAIPTGEDPDKISSAEIDEKQKITPSNPSKTESTTGGPQTEFPGLASLRAKWQTLHGGMDGYLDFYKDQQTKGFSEKQMETYLGKLLADKVKRGA